MKNTLSLTLAFGLAMACAPSAGDDAIWTGASVDCVKWLDGRSNNRAADLENYLVGFVDGLALGSLIEVWKAKNDTLNNERLFRWMDGYCQSNPRSFVAAGAITLANERSGGRLNLEIENAR